MDLLEGKNNNRLLWKCQLKKWIKRKKINGIRNDLLNIGDCLCRNKNQWEFDDHINPKSDTNAIS